jgi:hypothetical protein
LEIDGIYPFEEELKNADQLVNCKLPQSIPKLRRTKEEDKRGWTK